jgi:hypothetical protein
MPLKKRKNKIFLYTAFSTALMDVLEIDFMSVKDESKAIHVTGREGP